MTQYNTLIFVEEPHLAMCRKMLQTSCVELFAVTVVLFVILRRCP